MALTDRKIPIITGINDTPSTTGQPKHPNASLLCKNYNDLIDNELTALQQSVGGKWNSVPHTATHDYYWVDSVNGLDTNDGINSPIKTISKLHELITNKVAQGVGNGYLYIYLDGEYTNPDLDFSRYPCQLWESVENTSFTMIDIATSTTCTINISNTFALNAFTTGYNNATQWIKINIPVKFWGVTFNWSAKSVWLLHDVELHFDGCTFNIDGFGSSWAYGAIQASNSKFYLKDNTLDNETFFVDWFYARDCHFFIETMGTYSANLVSGARNTIVNLVDTAWFNVRESQIYKPSTVTLNGVTNKNNFVGDLI